MTTKNRTADNNPLQQGKIILKTGTSGDRGGLTILQYP